MSKVDFERAAMLMDVIAKISTIGVKNSNLLGLAHDELRQIEDTAREERQAIADAKLEEERQAAANDAVDNDQDGEVDEDGEDPRPDMTGGQSATSPATQRTTPVFPRNTVNETPTRRV